MRIDIVKFDSIDHCLKCGVNIHVIGVFGLERNVIEEYQEPIRSDPTAFEHPIIIPERLKVTCKNCGYWWLELCKDAYII